MSEDQEAKERDYPNPNKDSCTANVSRVRFFDREVRKWVRPDEFAFLVIPPGHCHHLVGPENAKPTRDRESDAHYNYPSYTEWRNHPSAFRISPLSIRLEADSAFGRRAHRLTHYQRRLANCLRRPPCDNFRSSPAVELLPRQAQEQRLLESPAGRKTA